MDLKRALQNLHPTYKEIIVRKTKIALGLLSTKKELDVGSLDLQTVYGLLGRLTYRMQLLDEIEKLFYQASSTARNIDELKELRDLGKRQVETARKLVGVYVYRDYFERFPAEAPKPKEPAL